MQQAGVNVTNVIGMYGDHAGEYIMRQMTNDRLPNHMMWETEMAEYPISFHNFKQPRAMREYGYLIYGAKIHSE